jgi:hypothetical protein
MLLLELDNKVGGNSQYGSNVVSAYPWGAHYLPVPDVRNKELLDFLAEAGVITGYDAQGLPVYNEYHLCMDPEERLYINGMWQEGIVPEVGVPAAEKEQIRRFFKMVADYKAAVGNDGKDAFAIPVDRSSADEQYHKLDAISFRQFLRAQGFTSRYLLWYLEYGCKDDYACNLDTTSAWAGIHYFASRKGKGGNTNSSGVLTWPQGNGFLMDNLRKQLPPDKLRTGQLVYGVQKGGEGSMVSVYDVAKKQSYTINARQVLFAAPQFVNKRLLAGMLPDAHMAARSHFYYAPWMIANITLAHVPARRGAPLCWDNVIYGTPSVGYVDANHQELGNSAKRVLTFYLPLVDDEPDAARRKAQAQSWEQWRDVALRELEFVHPGITASIEHMDVWLWGHGMISPRPGFIWGAERQMAMQPVGDRLFFAHSDLSGVSIFEEAFYQGIRAANEIINAV